MAVDPNAMRALRDLKIEIANELGINSEFPYPRGNSTLATKNIFDGGKIGGNMTKRMVEMAERGLRNKTDL
ncbi:alpha/beta-type small acid-soluble spore protein [Alkaliphilus pronyensis]|uniref:Alpha/beta-type small acid-soluble spore protein n=1 Tax=Alkaliphilus pronyensis TaxID=1482732 RepID=A0A6I0F6R3_9FIRM|nr:alpha/beta-type small acid-soluble spore protein [Alkaliphilus pronyensis]KAB3531644.1 alpha/beta-type small acid-soluble spore protein [Alkaliphilus pronyensis]